MKDSIHFQIVASQSPGLDLAKAATEFGFAEPHADRALGYMEFTTKILEARNKRVEDFLVYRDSTTCRETFTSKFAKVLGLVQISSAMSVTLRYVVNVHSGLFPASKEDLAWVAAEVSTVMNSFGVYILPDGDKRFSIFGRVLGLEGLNVSLAILLLRLVSIAKMIGYPKRFFHVRDYIEFAKTQEELINHEATENYQASPNYFGLDYESIIDQLMYLWYSTTQGGAPPVDYKTTLGSSVSSFTRYKLRFYSEYQTILGIEKSFLDAMRTVEAGEI
jgi:hypothetical protein